MATLEFERFKNVLKTSGHFVTKPRMQLFGLLQNHSSLTTVELIAKTPVHDRVTVYRNVTLFEELGIVTSLRIGNQTKIELSDRFEHHHHHMTCLNCGKIVVLRDNIAVEKEIERIGRGTGFAITDHSLEIRGVCKGCQQQKKLTNA